MCLLGSMGVAGRCRAEQFWAWPLLCQRDVKEIPYTRSVWLEATPSPRLTAPRCRVCPWDASGSHLWHVLFCTLASVQCGAGTRLGWVSDNFPSTAPPLHVQKLPCDAMRLGSTHGEDNKNCGYICLLGVYERWVLAQLRCKWNLVIWAYLQLCPRKGWHIYWAFFLTSLPNHMPQLSWNSVFSSFGEEGWRDKWTVTHIWVTPVKVTFDYFPKKKKHCIFGSPKQGHFQQSQQLPFMPRCFFSAEKTPSFISKC